MDISSGMIKDLRERTGAGMADCKKALSEVSGDMDKAIDWLRTKGLAKAAKKAGREATEGTCVSYIHGGGRVGVLVEVNCETDFVARNEDFVQFSKDVALQIAAMTPLYVRAEEVPAEAIEREKNVLVAKANEANADGKKPAAVIEKMVEGQLSKWKKEICLMDQAFVKDDKQTIEQVQTALVAKIGENIRVRRFVRFELGEGLEKKAGDDFATEVAKAAGLA